MRKPPVDHGLDLYISLGAIVVIGLVTALVLAWLQERWELRDQRVYLDEDS